MRHPAARGAALALAVGLVLPSAAAPAVQETAGMIEDVQRLEAPTNAARREALEAILDRLGLDFERQPFAVEPTAEEPRTEGVNLIVTLGDAGADIVVGGHYDAAWLGDALSPGATDNAASAVILTRLARALEDEPLRHRVRIVFFDMEELGLKGSAAYVRAHGSSTRAAVNLDVNGYGDTIFYGPAAAPGNAAVYRALGEACLESGLDCIAFPRFPATDHDSFQRAGIPNVSLSVLPAAEVHTLWLWLNGSSDGVFRPGYIPDIFRRFHTPEDTAAHVETGAMTLGYRAVLDLVRRLDAALD